MRSSSSRKRSEALSRGRIKVAVSACPNCKGTRLFRTAGPVSAGGGYAPNYLPGLGSVWKAEKFDVVVCEECGLTRLFAGADARARLASSKKWVRV
jgi:hypothetical protein